LTGVELYNFGSGTPETEEQIDGRTFLGLPLLSEADLLNFVELYIAYFNRAPDAIGLNFWGTAYANGTTLEEMATLFIDQDETRATYGEDLNNAGFATAVYGNVLGRVADQLGFDSFRFSKVPRHQPHRTQRPNSSLNSRPIRYF